MWLGYSELALSGLGTCLKLTLLLMNSLWVLWRTSHYWTCLPASHWTWADATLCLVVFNLFLVPWASASARQPFFAKSSPPLHINLLGKTQNNSTSTLFLAHILSTGKIDTRLALLIDHSWFIIKALYSADTVSVINSLTFSSVRTGVKCQAIQMVSLKFLSLGKPSQLFSSGSRKWNSQQIDSSSTKSSLQSLTLASSTSTLLNPEDRLGKWFEIWFSDLYLAHPF